MYYKIIISYKTLKFVYKGWTFFCVQLAQMSKLDIWPINKLHLCPNWTCIQLACMSKVGLMFNYPILTFQSCWTHVQFGQKWKWDISNLDILYIYVIYSNC